MAVHQMKRGGPPPPAPPPPPRPKGPSWEKTKFTIGKIRSGAIVGTQVFGSQTSPPPHSSNTSLAHPFPLAVILGRIQPPRARQLTRTKPYGD